MIDPNNQFTTMQRRVYAEDAAKWSLENKDPVVGSWNEHESWQDYDLLFEGLDTEDMIALDFGCGPGRMIARYWDKFGVINGADINETLGRVPDVLSSANKRFHDGFPVPTLYLVDGISLDGIPSNNYDLVFSTLCLQHIPVYNIRLNLFKEFYRVLKPGGWFTAQMGYGDDGDSRGVGYYENRWDAKVTNGGCDVKITDAMQLHYDLLKIGFSPIYDIIRPCGPNDWHPNWIFFRAQKPKE